MLNKCINITPRVNHEVANLKWQQLTFRKINVLHASEFKYLGSVGIVQCSTMYFALRG